MPDTIDTKEVNLERRYAEEINKQSRNQAPNYTRSNKNPWVQLHCLYVNLDTLFKSHIESKSRWSPGAILIVRILLFIDAEKQETNTDVDVIYILGYQSARGIP